VNTPTVNLPDDDELVSSAIAKRENGIGSDMTMWRWTHDPRIKFPPPDVIINNRKYWRRAARCGISAGVWKVCPKAS
jgi:hypothetical protein